MRMVRPYGSVWSGSGVDAMRGYDVIVVGARIAGSGTAMLLARNGLRVLVVDRSGLPADTVSSHQVQLPGVARLRRWGVLDRIVAAGTPATTALRFDTGGQVMDGQLPEYDGVAAMYSPRRTLLDALLLDAARAAGAEVRTGFRVDELLWSAGRVVGVRGRERGHAPVAETATLVIGADGKHSFVAGAVGARRYRQRPALAFASYSYWSGVALPAGELYQRPGRAVAAFPTNDDLAMVYTSAPLAGFAAARADLERHYLDTLDTCGDLGERVRAGVRVERLRSTPDQPNGFRVPCGPGWALVGDAGVVMDSISAQGISNALRDAEQLAAALVGGASVGRGAAGERDAAAPEPDSGPAGSHAASAGGLRGDTWPDRALAGHQRRRDAALRASYDFTVGLAGFAPPGLGQQHLLAAIADRPAEVSRFFGAFAGCVPIDRYLGAGNAVRILGARGLARLAAAGVRRLARPTRAAAVTGDAGWRGSARWGAAPVSARDGVPAGHGRAGAQRRGTEPERPVHPDGGAEQADGEPAAGPQPVRRHVVDADHPAAIGRGGE